MYDQSQSHDFIKPFTDVKTTKVPRSVFELGHYHQGTCSQGELCPIYGELCVPGDSFNIGVQSVVRMLALQSPAMTDIQMRTHFFFVPLRLLWNNSDIDRWSTFINGGRTGVDTPPIPLWQPVLNEAGTSIETPLDQSLGSLWDRFGFPVYDDTSSTPIGVNLNNLSLVQNDTTLFPTDFLRRAYNFIFNEYYINRNLMEDVPLDNQKVLKKMWKKDYFTSCLPWQQLGVAPLVPIEGAGNTRYDLPTSDITSVLRTSGGVNINYARPLGVNYALEGGSTYRYVVESTATKPGFNIALSSSQANQNTVTPTGSNQTVKSYLSESELQNYLNTGTVDFTSGGGISITDLREVSAIQLWMELNARGGTRYTEYLKAHYGVAPGDARLDRPEYIGGSSANIMISEVLQTMGNTDSPLGDMGGHGITADDTYIGEYHAEEWGVIVGLMAIEPQAVYSQGINRKWTQRTNLDFYDPLFANLSEQEVLGQEIYADNNVDNNQKIFGYQGRWDEYRQNHNVVTGDLRASLSYWTQQRYFDSSPSLNEEFVTCNPRQDIFAQTSATERTFVYTVQNMVRATRPLPAMADPSLTIRY